MHVVKRVYKTVTIEMLMGLTIGLVAAALFYAGFFEIF